MLDLACGQKIELSSTLTCRRLTT